MRVGGVLAGAALATYLPQFFLSPELRIGHGVLLGAGLVILAAGVLRDRDQARAPMRPATTAARQPVA